MAREPTLAARRTNNFTLQIRVFYDPTIHPMFSNRAAQDTNTRFQCQHLVTTSRCITARSPSKSPKETRPPTPPIHAPSTTEITCSCDERTCAQSVCLLSHLFHRQTNGTTGFVHGWPKCASGRFRWQQFATLPGTQDTTPIAPATQVVSIH